MEFNEDRLAILALSLGFALSLASKAPAGRHIPWIVQAMPVVSWRSLALWRGSEPRRCQCHPGMSTFGRMKKTLSAEWIGRIRSLKRTRILRPLHRAVEALAKVGNSRYGYHSGEGRGSSGMLLDQRVAAIELAKAGRRQDAQVHKPMMPCNRVQKKLPINAAVPVNATRPS